MYLKCRFCKKAYIEENEEICVDCAVFFSDENESIDRFFDEQVLDGDTLNDLGASFSEKDY